MDLIKTLLGGFFDPQLLDQIISVLLALEAIILGLVGIFGGAEAVKRYRESKFQLSLRRAIDTAIGLSDKRHDQVRYVQQSVPDAIKGLMKKKSPVQKETQIADMLEAHERLANMAKKILK